MALQKQAKIISEKQFKAVLDAVAGHRYPLRDRVMVLLSVKAGLRAKEIASLTWGMVTGSDGAVAETVELENRASKGKGGGRTIYQHPELHEALVALQADRGERARPDWPVIHSERNEGLTTGAVTVWFHRLYASLGMTGCSSHTGRRTFITRAAKKISEAGGSLRDVQQLAGHASLQTTARYIEGDTEAKRKVIGLI